MDSTAARAWFQEYLAEYGACGRGDRESIERLIEHSDAPLLLTSDARVESLLSRADVAAAIQRQIDGLRDVGHHRSAVLDSSVELVNAVTAIYRAYISRERGDGSEIGRLRVTYVLVDGATGPRISALLVHTP